VPDPADAVTAAMKANHVFGTVARLFSILILVILPGLSAVGLGLMLILRQVPEGRFDEMLGNCFACLITFSIGLGVVSVVGSYHRRKLENSLPEQNHVGHPPLQ
jgi:hypothetical protein